MTSSTSTFSAPRFAWMILFLLLLLATVFSALNVSGLFGSEAHMDFSSDVYRAVFLDNGQVYFGQVTSSDTTYLVLENVFYLQESGTDAEADFSLIKLGGELHGPEDRLHIFLSHVLYLEDLRSDSQVVERILEHQRLSL